MPGYTVEVHVDEHWVKEFQGNTKLCMASAVQDGSSKPDFNVISFTKTDLGPMITIKWEDNFRIAGARTGFVPGGEISVGTEITNIDYKKEFIFDTNWKAQVVDNPDAPANGFLFTIPPGGADMTAAATVYKKVGKASNLIYVSKMRGAGTRTLTPVNKVRLWWQEMAGPDTGGMIDKWGSYAITLDLTEVNEKPVWYLKNGDWSEKKP